MLKSLAKRAAKTLLSDGPNIPLASSISLPWEMKEKLALIEMATRSLLKIKMRTSFLPNARNMMHYKMPDRQRLGPIWQYWNSGASRCPPIIQECMASVQRHATGREIIVLSDDTLHDFITLPAHISAKREQMGATHFSDVLRVCLLAQHGGTWID